MRPLSTRTAGFTDSVIRRMTRISNKYGAKFVEGNLLMDYVDSDYVPVVRSKGYTYWRGGYTNRERFIAECHCYIDDSTEIINHRAKLIIEKLKNILEI